MIDKKTFKLINDFAKILTFKAQDIDDVVQTACEKLLTSPPKKEVTPAFYYLVVKRAQQDLYRQQDEALPKEKLPDTTIPENTFNLTYIQELDDKFQLLAKKNSGLQGRIFGLQADIFRLAYIGYNESQMARKLNLSRPVISANIKLLFDKIRQMY